MNLILSFDELEILLYSRGFRQIKGIKMPEKDFSAREVVQALAHLTENGIICAGEEAFRIREDVIDVLEIIGNPVSVSFLEAFGGRPACSCYFAPGCVVITQLHEFKEKTLRIMTFTEDEFAAWKEADKSDYC